jgi:ribosome maturation factor RimP
LYSREKIESVINPVLEQSGLFLVELSIGTNNIIKVLIDSEEGVSVDECVKVSRNLESALDRDEEDFELMVSSPGVGEPLKVFKQYIQNIGRTVEVATKGNETYKGELLEADENSILLRIEKNIKKGKKKVKQIEENRISFKEIMTTRVIIKI